MTEAIVPAVPTEAVPSEAVTGTDTSPNPDAGLRQLAAGTFGLPHLRDGQLAGMRALVAGRDVLAVMPTGYGKSAIYQVAALQLHRNRPGQSNAAPNPSEPSSARRGPAVVVSPLIALQEDQLDGLLEKLGGECRRRHQLRPQRCRGERRLGGRRARRRGLPLPGPRTAGQDRDRGAARGPGRLAVRGGRGPLRLLLGPRLPARLPAPRRGPRAAGQPARRRPHRHRLSPGARRNPAAPAA